MNEEQYRQLVQDVINGEESAVKAMDLLTSHYAFISSCISEVSQYLKQESGSNQADDQ